MRSEGVVVEVAEAAVGSAEEAAAAAAGSVGAVAAVAGEVDSTEAEVEASVGAGEAADSTAVAAGSDGEVAVGAVVSEAAAGSAVCKRHVLTKIARTMCWWPSLQKFHGILMIMMCLKV